MALSLLDGAQALAASDARLGADPRTEDGMAELLRAEVTARGMAPRAATLDRVLRLCAPAAALDPEALDATCGALVRNGDLVLARGGQLAATPLRAVPIADHARLVVSLPTRPLEAALGSPIQRRGLLREVTWGADVEASVLALGGMVVSPVRWAGLDRTPPADSAFLVTLDERLRWTGSHAAALDRGEPLDWRGLTLREGETRWRRDAAKARLWTARGAYRRFHAWTAGDGPPGRVTWIELSPDDSDRARFALARDFTLTAKLDADGDGHLMELPDWLPRAEYRWLALHAEPAGDNVGGGRWRLASTDLARVSEMLATRLGIVLEAQ